MAIHAATAGMVAYCNGDCRSSFHISRMVRIGGDFGDGVNFGDCASDCRAMVDDAAAVVVVLVVVKVHRLWR